LRLRKGRLLLVRSFGGCASTGNETALPTARLAFGISLNRRVRGEKLPNDKIITAFVVDDENLIATTVAMILNLSGFRASAFFSAEEALEAARRDGPPDLLVTDVAMPGMNGIDLAVTFENLYCKCKVLLFSGQTSTGNLMELAKEQGHEFEILAKPVHPNDLLIAVKRLGKSHMADLAAD
jgi:DNA-binding NtrC family response regulator